MKCPVCGIAVENNAVYHLGASDECRKELSRRVGERARSPETLSYDPVDMEVTKR